MSDRVFLCVQCHGPERRAQAVQGGMEHYYGRQAIPVFCFDACEVEWGLAHGETMTNADGVRVPATQPILIPAWGNWS